MHPLFENTQSLSDSELEQKIFTLNKRYFQTQNSDLKQQIVILLDDYKLELEARRERQKLQQSENGEEGLDNLIKIS